MRNYDYQSQREVLANLCQQLKGISNAADEVKAARKRVDLLGQADVFRWFIPQRFGGFEWSTNEILRGYLELSAACLSTAFVLTQRAAAVSRILASGNDVLKERLLPRLVTGEWFVTVGISHLTTSHRHLQKPVLLASKSTTGYVLNGFSPWVTGISFADQIVVGASCDSISADEAGVDSANDEGRYRNEILFGLPTDLPGIVRPATPRLVALSDSCTGPIHFEDVLVDQQFILDGPRERIMSQGSGGGTGGLQTSVLALGLSTAAISYLRQESLNRAGIMEPLESLQHQLTSTRDKLFDLADGKQQWSNADVRAEANSLVLRSTQAALMVAKGAGFCEQHPVGRWCQQALFFLVWSCPEPVTASNLCELAQIEWIKNQ